MDDGVDYCFFDFEFVCGGGDFGLEGGGIELY